MWRKGRIRRTHLVTNVLLALGLGALFTPAVAEGAGLGADTAVRAERAAAQRIAYRLDCNVWLADPDGTDKVNITPRTPGTCEGRPSISRTGRFVAYSTSSLTAPGVDIKVYDVRTRTTKRLTSDGRSTAPDFSPVNDQIAFHRTDPNNASVANIFSMTRSGDIVKKWTDDAPVRNRYRYNFWPEWNSNGSAIYFTSSRDDYTCRRSRGTYDDIFLAYQLYRVTTQGQLTQLTDNPRLEVEGVAVAGSSYAYTARTLPTSDGAGYCTSEPADVAALYVKKARRLTSSGFSAPTWTSGGRLVFETTGAQLASIARTGGAANRLFEGADPAWGAKYAPTKAS